MDLLGAASVIDEIRRRVESRRIDEKLAERIAFEILSAGSWEDILALLAAVSARVLARVAASWEHPCHCEPRRVAERAKLLYAAVAASSQPRVERLAEEECRARSSECRVTQTMFT